MSLIEDLHWIDRGSEAFLENYVEGLPGTRTLLVVNFRPEYHAPWMRRSYYQQLPLALLSAEAIDALLRDLVGADASVKALPDLIRERTRGNPFFIEEVVQALVEDGTLVGVRGAYRLVKPIDKVAVPRTVQAVLAARIDRLESREKHLLQTAAVIGKEFAEPVLKRVAEMSEAELRRKFFNDSTVEVRLAEQVDPEKWHGILDRFFQILSDDVHRFEGTVNQYTPRRAPEAAGSAPSLNGEQAPFVGDALEAMHSPIDEAKAGTGD